MYYIKFCVTRVKRTCPSEKTVEKYISEIILESDYLSKPEYILFVYIYVSVNYRAK